MTIEKPISTIRKAIQGSAEKKAEYELLDKPEQRHYDESFLFLRYMKIFEREKYEKIIKIGAKTKELKDEMGINSFKIYANLGQDLNRILMDIEPGSNEIVEGEVNTTDQIISDTIQEASIIHSIVLVHAEDPVICSKLQKQKQIERIY